jgi:hypothetical protein
MKRKFFINQHCGRKQTAALEPKVARIAHYARALSYTGLRTLPPFRDCGSEFGDYYERKLF